LRPKRPDVARNHRARGIRARSWPGVPRKALRAIRPPPTSASSAPTTEPTTGNGPEISGGWAAIRTPAHPGKAPDRQMAMAKRTKPAE
jgi:hypothetical protein